MFTGIIEGIGKVAAIRPAGTGRRMAIQTDFDLTGTRIGDSIAVNGACLTAVSLSDRRFEVDISPESIKRTTLGGLSAGSIVNLERALRLSDRLDGHLVSGHIDGLGLISARREDANAVIISFEVAPSLCRYMIEKGSVAVDGISLTINSVGKSGFSVSIIPYTADVTTLRSKSTGDAVNIETDMIGKYVERLFGAKQLGAQTANGDRNGVDMAFLAKTGFI